MAIEGKKRVVIYIDGDNYEFIKKHLDSRPGSGGVSGLVDKYLQRCAWSLRENKDLFGNIEPGKITLKKMWQLIQLQMKMNEDWAKYDHDHK